MPQLFDIGIVGFALFSQTMVQAPNIIVVPKILD